MKKNRKPLNLHFKRTKQSVAALKDDNVREALKNLLKGAQHYAKRGSIDGLAGCLDSIFRTAFVMHRAISAENALGVMQAVVADIKLPATDAKTKVAARSKDLTALHAAMGAKWTYLAMCSGTPDNPAPHCVHSHYHSCFNPGDGTGCGHSGNGPSGPSGPIVTAEIEQPWL